MSTRFPGRRLSILRLSGVLILIAGLVFSGFQGWKWFQDANSVTAKAWMAGYVDVTATPSFAFENPTDSAGDNVVLSFVVASKTDPCSPSWGTYYSMDEADQTLDLDRRIARRDQQGGDVIVSFGGLLNDELSTGCTDPDQLKKAYESVIDRYSLSTIDLDIEGANLTDTSSGDRRAAAIASIQKERAGTDSPLAVWLTLPVAPSGLTSEGTDEVTRMLSAGVDLAGVNVMTMDYGDSREAGQSMVDASIDAANSVHGQLRTLYDRQNISLGPVELWNKVGLTPMIGQNDVAGEIFTLDDAEALNAFAVKNGVGRMSMWSLNRDTTCGSNYPDVTRVSDSCSGVDQGDASFASLLGDTLTGSPESAAGSVTTSVPTSTEDLTDDPTTSPYRIWDADSAYQKDTKVVWHRQVYVAKYWTQGDIPDNPVLQASETPWELVGPVLPGETPVPVPVLPAGTYPEWQGTSIYTKGDVVMFDDAAYEAKWWTQGDSPQASRSDQDASPWRPLTDNEVRTILGIPTVGTGDVG
ncbi:chitinase [Agreia sp. Leaf283]|uniref:chitinase n=1 Tax=Agreia sp. Leaf283 TaxID=1736321 RepID=UPI0006FD2A3F|nr:carbohydrate-binding protein [Agreia sp. Leaf283]KQP56486.1 glycosyl hydrolase family 18 [Agreia sp. Leaf283]